MAKVQVNLRLDEDLVRKVDALVQRGLFKSRTEAIACAIKSLLREHYGRVLRERMEKVREGTESYPSVTKAVEEIHEGEHE